MIITGSIDGSSTRIDFSAYDPAATAVPLLWSPEDLIQIAAYDKNGTILEYLPNPKYPQYPEKCTWTYMATTETPSTTTGFRKYGGFGFTLMEGITEAEVYSVYAGSLPSSKFDSVSSPVKRTQTFNITTKRNPDAMFLTAHTSYTGQEALDLKFTNAFATTMIGVKGTAKIDSIIMKASGMTLAYPSSVTANVLNAPEAGKTDLDLLVSEGGKFINDTKDGQPVDGLNNVCVKFSNTLRLGEEIIWVPVMTMPFYAAENVLSFDIYATDKAGNKSKITKMVTVPDGVENVTTNSIVYVKLKEITAESLNQDAPRSDWQKGETLFADDFSWAKAQLGADMDKYGWTSPRNGNVYDKDNQADASAALGKKGYDVAGKVFMLNSYDGMLQLGEENNTSGRITLPLTDLTTWTGSVTVTFKAASYYNPFGVLDEDYWSGDIPVMAINGDATLKDVTIAYDASKPAFTWYEYTIVVPNATSATKIVFGGDPQDYYSPYKIFFFDDLKVTISNDGDTDNTTGTKIERPAIAVQYSEPELVNNAATITLEPIASVITEQIDLPNIKFSVTGPWKLEIPEDAATWLKVYEVQWSNYDDPLGWKVDRFWDEIGNEMTNVLSLKTIENNDTGADRTAALVLKSGEQVLATYNVVQPKAGVKTEVFAANFGDHADAVNASSALTVDDWGMGTYGLDLLGIAWNADNANPGLSLSNTAAGTQKYDGASKGGNLTFVTALAKTAGGGNEGGGDIDPWGPQLMADGDPAPVFVIKDLDVTNGEYLYLNYGLWAKDFMGYGEFCVDVIFDTNAPISVNPNIKVKNWSLMQELVDIPAGVTKCTIKMYAHDSYSSAADAYRIDDVSVSVRAKAVK